MNGQSVNREELLFEIFELVEKGEGIQNAINKAVEIHGKGLKLDTYSISGSPSELIRIDLAFILGKNHKRMIGMSKVTYDILKKKKIANSNLNK